MNFVKLSTHAIIIASGISCICSTSHIEIPDEQWLKFHISNDHPYIIATANDFKRISLLQQSHPLMQQWSQAIIKTAASILNEPTSSYEIPDGLRLLNSSRKVLYRTYNLALAYWLTSKEQYAIRLWNELHGAANFPNWNPRHFLDTAEMSHAFAIGYDWLYHYWSQEQKKLLREAMIHHALEPARACYDGLSKYGWWIKARHNWNQVCNGGISLSILALGNESPSWAWKCLKQAAESIQLAMAEYGPDGGWVEGPGYWNYATTYNVSYLAALKSSLGTCLGLDKINGFDKCGFFPIYITGPTGLTFNYADGGPATIRTPAMLWLAIHFNKPEFARYQKEYAEPHPLDLIWYKPELWDLPLPYPSNLDYYFRHAEVVIMRSSWNDPQAVFVGFKAGDNKANHSHLDVGSFVFDAGGQRWFIDLGADNYNLPGYFSNQRWNYYRLRAEGHNTIVIKPLETPSLVSLPDQDPQALTFITNFTLSTSDPYAVADLSAAYKPWANQLRRTLTLKNRSILVLEDFINVKMRSTVWLFFHTCAQIQLNKQSQVAILTIQDKKLVCKLLSPSNAYWQVMEAKPLPDSPNPEGQNPNLGIRKLAIALEATPEEPLKVVTSFELMK